MTAATNDTNDATGIPPHSSESIVNAPFHERIKLVSQNWAHSSPNRPSVMALYWVKYFFVLIGAWAFWCSFNAGYAGFSNVSEWAFTNEAFKKAMVWSMCWELFGFGCGAAPVVAILTLANAEPVSFAGFVIWKGLWAGLLAMVLSPPIAWWSLSAASLETASQSATEANVT